MPSGNRPRAVVNVSLPPISPTYFTMELPLLKVVVHQGVWDLVPYLPAFIVVGLGRPNHKLGQIVHETLHLGRTLLGKWWFLLQERMTRSVGINIASPSIHHQHMLTALCRLLTLSLALHISRRLVRPRFLVDNNIFATPFDYAI